MAKLVVRLLGGYRVELDGKAVYAFETDKARALFAFLIVEAERPHRRETLASLFWPDRPDAAARANLRQALSCIRRALTEPSHDPALPPFLYATSTDVQFNSASDYALDVMELEASLPAPGRHQRPLPEALCADFLAGFAVPDSEAFQEWVLNKQEHYHRLALGILDEQNTYFEANGNYEQAVAAARLQLRLEPWLEEAHRRCMRGLALAGRREEALHQYEACCRALKAELGVDPTPSTQALYADIRAARLALRHDEPRRSQGGPQEVGPGASESLSGTVLQLGSAVPAKPPAPLVAREDELGQLNCHLQAAMAGETGLAFVSGDAGSGKTALLEAFAAMAMTAHPGLLVAGARCNPGGSLDAFAPLRRVVEMLCGDLTSDVGWWLQDREQVDRLQRATGLVLTSIAEHGRDLIDTFVPAPSLAHRAGQASLVTQHAPASGDSRHGWDRPAIAQGALLDQCLCTLAAISREQPLLLLLDDLHWVDDATSAFLLHMGRELKSSRVLVLGAYRSVTAALGRRDPRTGETVRHPLTDVLTELRRAKGEILIELDRADGRAFVEAYVDTEPNRLGARFRDALYAQTGGHALFTVEMLRNLHERGELFKDDAGRWVAHEALDWGALPVRVEAAIAARIDRLPDVERRILSVASVQGDTFASEVTAELAGMPAPEVLAHLSGSLARRHQLVQPEGLQRSGSGPRAIYRFRHHLFQKYLYGQLDPVERVGLHTAVAAILERQGASVPGESERLAETLAWHYEAGGQPVEAARTLYDAGRQAMRVSAFRGALSHFDHGLALLATAPPSPERTEIARLLEVARLGPQRNIEWITSTGLEGTMARATQAVAGEAQGLPMLMLLWAQAERLMATGQFEAGLAAADRMREQATQWGAEEFVGLAHYVCGLVQHFMGNPQESERYLDMLRAWLTPERRARLRVAIGIGVSVSALAFSALNHWLLGYGEAALTLSQQAVADGRSQGDAVGQACSLALGASLLCLLRVDGGAVTELSEQCQRLCIEQSVGMWQPYARVLIGRLMAAAGKDTAGIEYMDSDSWRPSRMAVGTDFFVVLLADSCLLAASRRAIDDPVRVSLLAKGLVAIDSMLGPDRIPCGQVYEAELRRLQGELLLACDGLAAAGEALTCFERARMLGREKGAVAWELRATMSLVRLRKLQGEACAAQLADAQRRLADVYVRFTEGFAFPDLREAAGLIGNGNDFRHTESSQPGTHEKV